MEFLSGKTLFITGIGGFIGQHLTRRAIAQGATVRGIQRSEAKAEAARRLGAEVWVGDITDPATVAQAAEGCDLAIHCAALAKEGGDFEEYRRVNVGGSVTVAEAVRQAGATTFVHLSSVMVYGFDYPRHITEDGPLRGENNPYCQSKIESETAVLKLNQPPEFGVIVIRPGDVYGPGSLWVDRPLELMRNRRFLLADGGRGVINHVYVDNLIDGIFLAIEQQAHGEIFNLTDGSETSWGDYFRLLAATSGITTPILSLPAGVVKTLIKLRSLAQRLMGQEPDTLSASVDFFTRPHAYSIEKARTRLGYEPRVSLTEGMKQVKQALSPNSSNFLDPKSQTPSPTTARGNS